MLPRQIAQNNVRSVYGANNLRVDVLAIIRSAHPVLILKVATLFDCLLQIAFIETVELLFLSGWSPAERHYDKNVTNTHGHKEILVCRSNAQDQR